jgi:predicted O-methyltransferase YrrM
VGTFLRILVRLTAPLEILEIGCFTGFATAMILEELRPGARLTCLDISRAHLDSALSAVSPLPQEVETRFVCDDGYSWLARNSCKFDFILLDARKDRIHECYELIANSLTSGGVLIVDNALLQGSVLNPKKEWEVETDLFNKRLAADSAFLCTLLPVRDGLNLAVKI